jgi:hypothetical protein
MARNVRSEIYAFWRRYVIPRGLAGAVRVSWRDGETFVTIDDVLPRLPFTRREAGWSVTTKTALLRSDHFLEKTARSGIHFNDEKDRGRTVYLHHRPAQRERREVSYRGQMVAALSLHIDKDAAAPLIVNNLAIRGDTPDHTDLSRAAAGWMMAYLLEVARQDSRPPEIGVEIDTQPNANDFVMIGFRSTSTPAAYAAPYLAFHAPRYSAPARDAV